MTERRRRSIEIRRRRKNGEMLGKTAIICAAVAVRDACNETRSASVDLPLVRRLRSSRELFIAWRKINHSTRAAIVFSCALRTLERREWQIFLPRGQRDLRSKFLRARAREKSIA